MTDHHTTLWRILHDDQGNTRDWGDLDLLALCRVIDNLCIPSLPGPIGIESEDRESIGSDEAGWDIRPKDDGTGYQLDATIQVQGGYWDPPDYDVVTESENNSLWGLIRDTVGLDALRDAQEPFDAAYAVEQHRVDVEYQKLEASVRHHEQASCRHGNPPGECADCDHEGDLAYDAAREIQPRKIGP